MSDRRERDEVEGSELGSEVCKDLGKIIGTKGIARASAKALRQNILGMLKGQCGWSTASKGRGAGDEVRRSRARLPLALKG